MIPKTRQQEVEKEILDLLKQSRSSTDPDHAVSTKKWLLEIYPEADEIFQVSALGHDIERAINNTQDPHISTAEEYDEFKKGHAIMSAEMLVDMLRKHGYSDDDLLRVYAIVANHEFGGNKEADILMDADSISYFDTNIERYLQKHGMSTTKKKIRFMYDRCSKRAQEYIKNMKLPNPELDMQLNEISK